MKLGGETERLRLSLISCPPTQSLTMESDPQP